MPNSLLDTTIPNAAATARIHLQEVKADPECMYDRPAFAAILAVDFECPADKDSDFLFGIEADITDAILEHNCSAHLTRTVNGGLVLRGRNGTFYKVLYTPA